MEKTKVYRAGMICYRVVEEDQSDNIQMLFMRPSDPEFGGSDFQCCKGKVDPGETTLEAAVREAKEEVGLFKGCIVKGPVELGTFLGRTTFYVCKVKPDALFGEPSFETAETKWMTLEQFMAEGRSLHKPVVSAAHRLIKKMEE